MSGLSPRAADRVRKTIAYVAAGVGTLWLLRVLYRLAHGRLAWNDVELWSFLGLLTVMVLWVRAAKPVRRAPDAQVDDSTAAGRTELPPGRGPGVPWGPADGAPPGIGVADAPPRSDS
ncbi:MAG: hypothetical protein AB7T63_07620 [Planctomycetota bacterium]